MPFWFVASAFVLAAWSLALEVHDLDLKWWSTTLQLVGGILAFCGFGSAYVRAAYGLPVPIWFKEHVSRFHRWITRLWNKLLRKPISVSVFPGTAKIKVRAHTPSIRQYPGALSLDRTRPLKQQVAQIADYANKLQAEVPKLLDEIGRLDGRIDKVHVGASESAEKALDHIQKEIEALTKRLDQSLVKDLQWAICGLGITVVGIALGY
ncbi:prefoldin domain-containing protein [Mycobacterium montefiorense]|uniref:hypothetical protein n=1 Tax=Mycobacterium montefiorense TaxID=154654 RepID=UPI001057D921|nr:hypothetical protein [Mycobacterium montefiorense]GKU35967.1 hypothetical protein NJB14191_33130 [Mycobacterium montefiorense]